MSSDGSCFVRPSARARRLIRRSKKTRELFISLHFCKLLDGQDYLGLSTIAPRGDLADPFPPAAFRPRLQHMVYRCPTLSCLHYLLRLPWAWRRNPIFWAVLPTIRDGVTAWFTSGLMTDPFSILVFIASMSSPIAWLSHSLCSIITRRPLGPPGSMSVFSAAGALEPTFFAGLSAFVLSPYQ